MRQPVILAADSGSTPALPTHRNPGLEIVVVREGELRWHVEGVVYRVPPGSVFFTFPWEAHGSVSEREPGHRWDYLQIHVGGPRAVRRKRPDPQPVFGNSPEARRILRNLLRATTRVAPAGTRLPHLVSWAVRDHRSDPPPDPAAGRWIAGLCLVELVRCLTRGGENWHPTVPPAVGRFLDQLKAHPEEPWTLAEMAARCGLGRTQFAKLIRRATGDTPMEHLQRLRIERAKELLRDPRFGITSVAMECGFSTSQHFARVFRRFAGMTPGDFRAGRARR